MKTLILICTILILSISGYSQFIFDNQNRSDQFDINYRKLVSRADLKYDEPYIRSEDGVPIGTGTMGTMVWTSPSTIKMQINRVDVFGMDRTTNSFTKGNSTYGNACGFVDINFVDYGEDVFTNEYFKQELSVYDGQMVLNGKGVVAELFAWMENDVIAVKITDNRDNPFPISIDLRMLRYMMQIMGRNYVDVKNNINSVRTASHIASSQLHISDNAIALSQKFTEKEYYNTSAVTAKIIGREYQTRLLNQTTARLIAAPAKGSFVILISSASSFNRNDDIVKLSTDEIEKAERKGYDTLFIMNREWWHNFWERSFVHLTSKDGSADYVEENYTYFQYLMASCSQGDFQPRFGGMLWSATADAKNWGAQYWVANQRCFYLPLPPTNRFELMSPLYFQYYNFYDSYATAAEQQWGSKGLWIPETTWFNGIEELPEDIAAEIRDLYLMRKPWEQRSQKFKDYADSKNKFNSRWNWGSHAYWGENGKLIYPENQAAPYAYVTHIMSGTPQIAYYFWLKYEYTMDRVWLEKYAYPMIKGAIEFYRNFPNLKKGADGKYHIYHVNNNEPIWNSTDALWDISAIRGLTPILLRASEILNKDIEMRPIWKELLENIAPLPTTAMLGDEYKNQPERWIGSIPPAAHGDPATPGRASFLDFYDMVTIGSEREAMKAISNASFDAMYKNGVSEKTPVVELDRTPIGAARLGRAEDAGQMIFNQLKCANIKASKFEIFQNRMTAKPGFGAIGAQRIGNASAAVNELLLQSVPPAPGGDPVIYVFPACPKEWNAAFTLLARGAFLVSSAIEGGKIDFVEIKSKVGGDCKVSNPWPGRRLVLYRNGEKAEILKGLLLSFSTTIGENIVIVPVSSGALQKVNVPLNNTSHVPFD